MISQTSSGQTFLKRLVIDFNFAPWLRVMDGVLIRILKRMRGLQSVKLDFECDWLEIVNELSLLRGKEQEERAAQDFLLLIKEELSHIKKITIEWEEELEYAGDVETWMSHELEERNEAWAPPLPRYKKFRRTFSPMAIMDVGVAKSVVQREQRFKPENHDRSLFHLKRKYGVF